MTGDVLDHTTYAASLSSGMIVVHLVGTPRPSPAKTAELEAIDQTKTTA